MESLLIGLFFVLGALIASFVGVLVVRLNTGQSFITGRSRCDACGKFLTVFSLIPILSYGASRGRAQCCGARISLMSPLSEVLLGVLFAIAYLSLGLNDALPFFLISLALLLALVLYDLMHQILPPPLLYTFVGTSLLSGFLMASSLTEYYWTLLIAACIGLSLAAIHFFSRGRAMGLADAPLAFGLAVLSGPLAPSGFVFSFWIGAVVGIAMLAQRPVGSRMGVEVPFAPFLSAGFLLAYFTQWNLFTIIAAFH